MKLFHPFIDRPGDKPSFGYTQRFGLNRRHLLAQKLAVGWLFNEHGGDTAFSHGRMPGSELQFNAANMPTWVPTGQGGIYTDNTASSVYAAAPISSPVAGIFHAAFTRASWVTWATIEVDTNGPMTLFEEGGSSKGIAIGYRNGPNTINFVVKTEGTDDELASSTTFTPSNDIICIGCVFDNGAVSLYINGVLEDTGSGLGAIGEHADEPGVLGPNGTDAYNSGEEWGGALCTAYRFDDVLTDQDMALLYADPYAMFRHEHVQTVFSVPAAGDLSIDISQSIDVSESVALAGLITDIAIDLYDQLNLTESISVAMNLGAISINEAVGLSEALDSGVPLGLLKSDNITIVEFLALLESIAPSKFESITITEYFNLLKDIGLSEFENITVSELVAAVLAGDMQISVSESVTVAEFVGILKDIGIDISQSINVSEVVSALLLLSGIDESESVTVNEAISFILNLAGINTAQSINVSELVSAFVNLSGINVSDDLTVTEFLTVLATNDRVIPDMYESISVVEAITLLFSILPLSAAESVSVSESIEALLSTTGINVSDNITVSEYISLLLTLGLVSESESVTVSEAITALLETTGANVSETISISEYVLSILDVTGINISQPVTISEYVYVTMVSVAGLMRVAFSVLKPSVTFSVAKTRINFN